MLMKNIFIKNYGKIRNFLISNNRQLLCYHVISVTHQNKYFTTLFVKTIDIEKSFCYNLKVKILLNSEQVLYKKK